MRACVCVCPGIQEVLWIPLLGLALGGGRGLAVARPLGCGLWSKDELAQETDQAAVSWKVEGLDSEGSASASLPWSLTPVRP